LKLFCWVLNTSVAFPVNIARRKTVGHLKDAIKKEKESEFNHLQVDADWLDIWKVSGFSRHVSIRRSDIREAILTHSFF
jgi:hypothetical protein